MNAPPVLLVYANPSITATPVVPYGMERVAWSLRMAGCAVTMLCPFIEADPRAMLAEALAAEPWALVGFSVRNLDDALVVARVTPAEDGRAIDTVGYVDAVRPLVEDAVAAVGPDRVCLGGAAVSAGPEVVVAALGASWGIAGPADDLVWALGRCLARGEPLALDPDPRVVQLGAVGPLPGPPPRTGPVHDPVPRPRRFADAWRPVAGPTPRLGPYLALARARQGRVPVLLSAGCDRRCHFCVEARFTGYAVHPRPVDEIIAEIDSLVALGVRRFWLVASELNVADERHATAVLRALAGRRLDLQAFVQVAPMSDTLLDAMEDAGMDPSALSFELGHLDDRILRAGGGPANRRAIDALVETWLRRGYRTLGGSVLLGAHPMETEETVAHALDAALELDRSLPDGFGLAYATGARVYPRSALADWVTAHPREAAPHLYGADDPTFVQPVVFCRPWAPRALLGHVAERLARARGQMGPMNSEAPSSAAALAAEASVNRGIWRLAEGRASAAAVALEEALRWQPDHLEALAQLAMLRANRLGDPAGARDLLGRLLAALPPRDPRRGEVSAALEALS